MALWQKSPRQTEEARQANGQVSIRADSGSLAPRFLEWARTHDPEQLLIGQKLAEQTLLFSVTPLGHDCEFGLIAVGYSESQKPGPHQHLLTSIAAGNAGLRLLHSLRRSEERFRALIDASAQIVWTASATGAVVEDSDSWRSFTGQKWEEFKGYGWLQALHPEDRAAFSALWDQAVRTRAPLSAEYRLAHETGQWRWTAIRAVPRMNGEGQLQEWVMMNVDITDRKKAEETP